jgi:chemotaxis protein methyltransferase CheR
MSANAIKSVLNLDATFGLSPEYEIVVKVVADYVAKISGNVLEKKQFSMVENRLKKRMMTLKINSPEEYLTYLSKNKVAEVTELVSLLTTHHTFFFREFIHFELLLKNLPNIIKNIKSRGESTLKVWSAASSKGHEVFSLAIFLDTHLKKIDPSMNFEIFGSDIDPQSVAVGKNAVYHKDEIKEIPMLYLADNFARGTGDIADFVKVKKKISEKCKFDVLNLLDLKLDKSNKFDIIFCRNVLIYFKQPDIVKVIDQFKQYLHPTGYLFTGLSESLTTTIPGIFSIGASCYTFNEPKIDKNSQASKITNVVELKKVKPIRILCVDDSPSILKILQKIFTAEHGMEVVGTAINGLEAEKFLANNQVDLMTLDIHMPEMDGVAYLRKNYRAGKHPPVMMVSSVSRDDSDLAQKALLFGASEFVEKPSLENLAMKSEEMRMKIHILHNRNTETKTVHSTFDKEFSKDLKIVHPEQKFVYVCASTADRQRIGALLKDLADQAPPMVIATEGASDVVIETMAQYLKGVSPYYKIIVSPAINTVMYAPGDIYLVDLKKTWNDWKSVFQRKKSMLLIYSGLTRDASNFIEAVPDQVITVIEEVKMNEKLYQFADELVPATTFSYLVKQKFGN